MPIGPLEWREAKIIPFLFFFLKVVPWRNKTVNYRSNDLNYNPKLNLTQIWPQQLTNPNTIPNLKVNRNA